MHAKYACSYSTRKLNQSKEILLPNVQLGFSTQLAQGTIKLVQENVYSVLEYIT